MEQIKHKSVQKPRPDRLNQSVEVISKQHDMQINTERRNEAAKNGLLASIEQPNYQTVDTQEGANDLV